MSCSLFCPNFLFSVFGWRSSLILLSPAPFFSSPSCSLLPLPLLSAFAPSSGTQENRRALGLTWIWNLLHGGEAVLKLLSGWMVLFSSGTAAPRRSLVHPDRSVSLSCFFYFLGIGPIHIQCIHLSALVCGGIEPLTPAALAPCSASGAHQRANVFLCFPSIIRRKSCQTE